MLIVEIFMIVAFLSMSCYFQDSILSINAAMCCSDLRTAVCAGLHSALLNVVSQASSISNSSSSTV